MVISDEELRDAFLSPQMRCYFGRKLPDVPPAELDARIDEALKFLNMATYCRGRIPVTPEIDDIWHLWMLETREYQHLCGRLQGRRFLHHSSDDLAACGGEPRRSGGDERENDLEEDVAMFANYVLNYGPFRPDRVRYWLLAAHLVERCGWSVEQLNDWLAPAALPVAPSR